jgi:hypothetical protein
MWLVLQLVEMAGQAVVVAVMELTQVAQALQVKEIMAELELEQTEAQAVVEVKELMALLLMEVSESNIMEHITQEVVVVLLSQVELV